MRVTGTRRRIGMVFQKPNQFPAMPIRDNVSAGLKMAGVKESPEVTIVIVTHDMQQAARVSQHCAFFLAEDRAPGHIVESAPTDTIFAEPADPRTADYVHGRFG